MTYEPITEEPREDETRVQFVMRQVAEHIGRQGLKVGDQLPSETSFAEMLSVSRPVVREAFGALGALNMIEIANGRRPRVSAIDGSVLSVSMGHAIRTDQISIQEVWETRRCLETETIALAAVRRSDEEAARITEIAAAMASAEPGSSELMTLDIALHKAIATASRNTLMAQIIGSFAPMLESSVPAAWDTITTKERHAVMLVRHAALADRIRARDADGARQAMDDHFDRSVGARLTAR